MAIPVYARRRTQAGTCLAEMVRRGLSWAFVKYSSDYVAEEAEARAAHRGVWQADTQTAWDFRAMRWAELDKVAPEGCLIKGIILTKYDHDPILPGVAPEVMVRPPFLAAEQDVGAQNQMI